MNFVFVIILVIGFLLAIFPAALFFLNLSQYAPPRASGNSTTPRPAVSLLIPARNEERVIEACVRSALASMDVDLEVIVLDDGSSDGTAEIVARVARQDPRVRLESAPPLPADWCGKQHACWALAGLAQNQILAFLDADVRLEPAGLAQAAEALEASGAALLSGVPRQETRTLLEKLLIPLIYFVLLGFLPIRRMRRSTSPAYGAGCGQFFITPRTAYQQAGGHRAIRTSLHDGLMLPRAYRRAGLRTDLFDATPVARCRMYRNAAEVWNGLVKNALEGMAHPVAIVPWTLLLIGGQVLPCFTLVALISLRSSSPLSQIAIVLCSIATAAFFAVRIAGVIRFKQSVLGAALHPVGILMLIGIQWHALVRRLIGKSSTWRGRTYTACH